MRVSLGWGLAVVLLAGCASTGPVEPRTAIPIVDVKMVAGAWTGYIVSNDGIRADNASLVISDSGSFQVSGQAQGRGFTTNGEIAAGSGKATYRTTRSSGTVALFRDGSKEVLRFDGSTARERGYSEWERVR